MDVYPLAAMFTTNVRSDNCYYTYKLDIEFLFFFFFSNLKTSNNLLVRFSGFGRFRFFTFLRLFGAEHERRVGHKNWHRYRYTSRLLYFNLIENRVRRRRELCTRISIRSLDGSNLVSSGAKLLALLCMYGGLYRIFKISFQLGAALPSTSISRTERATN